MVDPFAQTGLFETDNVLRLLDHADSVVIASGIRAYPAGLSLGKTEAYTALANILLEIADRLSQPHRLVGAGPQDMKGHPLGCLGPNARQPAKLLNKFIQTFSIFRIHHDTL
jgi:hypothetical protein